MSSKLWHTRLKTGEEILGLLKVILEDQMTIEFPYQVVIGSDGWYAKPFGSGLTDIEEVTFQHNDVYMSGEASNYGYSIYKSIIDGDEDDEQKDHKYVH